MTVIIFTMLSAWQAGPLAAQAKAVRRRRPILRASSPQRPFRNDDSALRTCERCEEKGNGETGGEEEGVPVWRRGINTPFTEPFHESSPNACATNQLHPVRWFLHAFRRRTALSQ
ncbi:hypothetical protein GMDG_08749 [Pseudogymnoascus destructans 20631-21]|uniref:Secreted protein n=1 Tax=Pseudogymnoascus destructans (strain ATCC MYA-4855 / 20631-21) TaxID=658429 RepID=L8GCU4_PSED2|nr:hypothetical protein GMDG_08749 [Pseudogymnoascus destructans 20631-21]